MSPNGELLFVPILSKPNLYKQVSDILGGENIVEQWTGLVYFICLGEIINLAEPEYHKITYLTCSKDKYIK